MKYRVIKRFRDKNTKDVYEIDSTYESDNEKRVKELQALGYLGEEIEEAPSILDQNVSEVKAAITKDFPKEILQVLLEQEIAGENRKGVKEHIESLLAENEGEGV